MVGVILVVIAVVAIVLYGKYKANKNSATSDDAKAQTAQKKEEERRRQEEANRFNPDGKPLEWFASEDGIKTYHEYVTAQNYILEETLQKEHEAKYSEYDFEIFLSVVHKGVKLPSTYFRKLVDAIPVQMLQYVGPTNMLVKVLSVQAKPFYMDDDGEPQVVDPTLTPEECVSVEKNPALNFVKNFNCFELADDGQGSWKDKWELLSTILIWLGVYSSDREILANNPWVFSKEMYLNELGSVRKLKGFCKKCIELTTDEKYKAHFEEKYNECQ